MSRGGSLPLIAPEGGGGVLQMTARAQAAPAASAALGDQSWVNELYDQGEKEKRLNRMVKVASLGNDYAQLLDAKREELAGDPDYNSREARFRAYATEQQQKLAKGLDKETGDYFLTHSTQMAQANDIAVRANARKDRRDDAIATLAKTNNDLVVQAGNAPNEGVRATILGQIATNLDNGLKTNVLTAAEAKTLSDETLKAADRASALRTIRGDPGGTAQRLADPAYLPNLDPVTRENLINAANAEVRSRTAQAYTQEARREIAERRTTAAMGDEAMKTISDLMDLGKTVEAEDTLAKFRPALKHADYEAGKAMIRGEAKFDDRDTLARIVPNIDVSDQSEALNDAVKTRNMTGSTYRSLSERNRNALKDDQPSSPFRQGLEHIKTKLDPQANGLGGGLLGGITAGLRADALLEYYAWADAHREQIKDNPNLSIDFARNVVDRYKLVEFTSTTQALGLPRFYAGNRNDVTEADIKSTGSKIEELFKAGQLSEAEYFGQARLLRNWINALKAKPSSPPPAGGPK